MADENIGGVSVSITGDYSPLQAVFQEAQSAAQTAGANIAEALTSGAASAESAATELSASLGQITTAASDAAASITPMGAAADEATAGVTSLGDASTSTGAAAEAATGGVQDLGSSAQTTGESAGEAGNKLADMAEKLTLLAEALAVTEGLREFGAEALAASDAVTHASISLNVLTGDAEKTKVSIEELQQLGASDALAMPSLLSAATRMTAILAPGMDVVGLLGHIADGAAVMGTDIESAATRFDQLATAGMASARTLTSIGLSLQSLADAMNKVSGNTEATAANAAVMFKALDQSERVDVLTTALSKLGGTAEQVAQQTFGGQWQQLANAWEEVMVQAGQALLPVITELLDFVKLDVVPFVQGLAEAFRALPEPLQNGAVGLGLVVAAAAPLTAGLAAVGLAVSGLQNLIPAFTGVLSSLATTEETAAVSTTALGTAMEATSAEATIAEAGIVSLGGVIAVGFVAAIAAAVISLTELKTSLDNAHASLQNISDKDLNNYIANITLVKQGTGEVSSATEQWTTKQQLLKEGLDLGTISAKQYATGVDALTKAEQAAVGTGFGQYLDSVGASALHFVSAIAPAHDTISLLSTVLADAKTKLDALTSSYDGSAEAASKLLSAQGAVASAQQKLNDEIAAGADALNTKLAAATQAAALAFEAAHVSTDNYTKSLDNGAAAFGAWIGQARQAADAADNFGIVMMTTDSQIAHANMESQDFGITMMHTVIPAEDDVAASATNATGAVNALGDAFAKAGADATSAAADFAAAVAASSPSAALGGTPKDMKLGSAPAHTHWDIRVTPGYLGGGATTATLIPDNGYMIDSSGNAVPIPGATAYGGAASTAASSGSTASVIAQATAQASGAATPVPNNGSTDPIDLLQQSLVDANNALAAVTDEYHRGTATAQQVLSAQNTANSIQQQLLNATVSSVQATASAAVASTAVASVISQTTTAMQTLGVSVVALSATIAAAAKAPTNVASAGAVLGQVPSASSSIVLGGGGSNVVGQTTVINFHLQGAQFGAGMSAATVQNAFTQALRTAGARF